MDANPPPEIVPAHAGLCARCRNARAILNDRDSRFVLCERSRVDPAFRRYPALPVVACAGFEPAEPGGAAADTSSA